MQRRTLIAAAVAVLAFPRTTQAEDESIRAIQAEVEDIIRRFLELAGPLAAGIAPPRAIVAFTPQLGWINEGGTEVHTAAWSRCPPPLQTFFSGLLGDPAPMAPELFFHEVFNAFLVPHEMSHVFDARRGRLRNGGRLYDGEVHANRVAVAFWMG